MKKQAIINVKNLVARYGDDLILKDISFDVFEGEILVVLGSSGCGKSTLLRHMIGLDRPFSGNIMIEGEDITSSDDSHFNALKKIGVLFQSSALFGSMTVAENIALPIQEYSGLSKSSIANLVRMKLCMVNLDGYENYLPSEISGGMKKRAGLARALALNPKILFLDEPTAGLDPVSSAEIDELILLINKSIGATIVIVTHALDSILNIAQRIIMLDKKTKSIIAEGDPRYLKDNSQNVSVRQFFNRKAKSRI
ncbi:MAG: ATP-binding cassette domain-containing protein [Proteobacteria bacterium]|nr:ATP-binding cassette domain-containing protein [Desulfobacteraceae bacterium]MBU2521337.1 ATP-binding cassette domain-containing protein [Pseudomonadota bacterium]MBU3979879.1 ATP-binding cassette domain-containing protein [Pseudomonadota bacterium]MBU4013513.1 ATP-binding cassette domain-containing protein [Pseudomonadota bacterium]MBU4068110.1 ATP-binding cassette domain-containing protein [Pseudomonadota bacterium]